MEAVSPSILTRRCGQVHLALRSFSDALAWAPKGGSGRAWPRETSRGAADTLWEANGPSRGPASPARLDPRSLTLVRCVSKRAKNPNTSLEFRLLPAGGKTPWTAPQCCLPGQLCFPIPEAAKAPGTPTQIPPVRTQEPEGADSCCHRIPDPQSSLTQGQSEDPPGR